MTITVQIASEKFELPYSAAVDDAVFNYAKEQGSESIEAFIAALINPTVKTALGRYPTPEVAAVIAKKTAVNAELDAELAKLLAELVKV